MAPWALCELEAKESILKKGFYGVQKRWNVLDIPANVIIQLLLVISIASVIYRTKLYLYKIFYIGITISTLQRHAALAILVSKPT